MAKQSAHKIHTNYFAPAMNLEPIAQCGQNMPERAMMSSCLQIRLYIFMKFLCLHQESAVVKFTTPSMLCRVANVNWRATLLYEQGKGLDL